jgi:hypothetical protein
MTAAAMEDNLILRIFMNYNVHAISMKFDSNGAFRTTQLPQDVLLT